MRKINYSQAKVELTPVLNEEMDRHNRRCVGILCAYEDEDVCNSFITAEDVPDNDVDILEEVDRRLREGRHQRPESFNFIGKPCACPEEFCEKELCPEKSGIIEVASVDVRNGVIYLLKDGNPPKEYGKPVYMQPEKMGPRKELRGKNTYFCLDTKYFHENLKTMPERKVQRMHRVELRAVRGKF